VEALGKDTTLLVDTYDIEEGIANAVEVAGKNLGAIRIDSGDPFEVVPAARKQLDELGATNTRIVLSGDLNAQTLREIIEAELPVDSYGIGTSVVTGNGYPAAGFVYKLVSIEDETGHPVSVAKKSSGGKKSIGGAKTAYREYDEDWQVVGEHLLTDESGTPIFSDWDRLQVPYIASGKLLDLPTTQAAREKHLSNLAEAKVSEAASTYVNDDKVWELNPTPEPEAELEEQLETK